jgi:hypothetical protein
MLEKIRTFFGKVRGLHGERKVIVQQGSAWVCTRCRMVFLTKEAGEKHGC